MVRRGFLTREPVAYDDRLKKLCLTEKSRRLHEEAMADVPRLEQVLCRDIPEEDLQIFHRVLNRLKANLEQEAGISGREETCHL